MALTDSASTERTPLLTSTATATAQNVRGDDVADAEAAVVEPTNVQPAADPDDDGGEEQNGTGNDVAVAQEPGSTKLTAIMFAIWIGVFFAALGKYLPYLIIPPTLQYLPTYLSAPMMDGWPWSPKLSDESYYQVYLSLML